MWFVMVEHTCPEPIGFATRRRSTNGRAGTILGAPAMCRNIRVLHHFEPPVTEDEIRAAALQYVRKVSGLNKPARADEAAFARAIEEIAASTSKLLHTLPVRGDARTREQEREKSRARFQQRVAREARVATK